VTRDEAIAIRSRQLCGGCVSRNEAAQAEEVLKQCPNKPDWVKKKAREMLARLAPAPMEREDFLTLAKSLYEGCAPSAVWTALARLEECGLICSEVRLTDAGMQVLSRKRRKS
jgi:hypothetical protein